MTFIDAESNTRVRLLASW